MSMSEAPEPSRSALMRIAYEDAFLKRGVTGYNDEELAEATGYYDEWGVLLSRGRSGPKPRVAVRRLWGSIREAESSW